MSRSCKLPYAQTKGTPAGTVLLKRSALCRELGKVCSHAHTEESAELLDQQRIYKGDTGQ